jgi:hypothetical protein
MKTSFGTACAISLFVLVLASPAPMIRAQEETVVVGSTADEYGYDYVNRTFDGLYENADRDSQNNTGCEDRLRMEWSEGLNLADISLSAPGSELVEEISCLCAHAPGTERHRSSVKLVFTGPGSAVMGHFTIAEQSTSGSCTMHDEPFVLPRAP